MSTTTTLFGSTEAQAARDLIGGTAIGDIRNDLLKQILVATANKAGGSSSVAFADITGSPTDNAALAAALAAKLDLAGGTMTGALAITAGALNTSPLSVTQTWNNAGVTCRGFEYAVTDTNSAADSTLFRILGGAAGASQLFNVDKNGWINGPTGATMVIAPASGTNLALYARDGGIVQFYSPLNLGDGGDIACGTVSGNKIGTATTQKIAFWNAPPVVQPAHIADPSGGATVDAEARTAINSILAWQATLGLTAAA